MSFCRFYLNIQQRFDIFQCKKLGVGCVRWVSISETSFFSWGIYLFLNTQKSLSLELEKFRISNRIVRTVVLGRLSVYFYILHFFFFMKSIFLLFKKRLEKLKSVKSFSPKCIAVFFFIFKKRGRRLGWG